MKRVRDFHSQTWDNPFFGRASAGRWVKIAWLVGALILIALVLYGLVYSPLFRINNIVVNGASTVEPVRIQVSAAQLMGGYDYLILPNDYFFIVSPVAIENHLLALYPKLISVDVKKSFNKLSIEVTERKASYRLIIGDKAYILDQEGLGMHEAKPPEGDALVALKKDNAVFGTDKRTIDKDWINAANNLHKYFATHVGVRDSLYVIDDNNASIEAVTTEGWYAVIDPTVDIPAQLKILSSALLSKFNSTERQKLLYIDVRFGEKVYYKWR